jgi:hypothetical protein
LTRKRRRKKIGKKIHLSPLPKPIYIPSTAANPQIYLSEFMMLLLCGNP